MLPLWPYQASHHRHVLYPLIERMTPSPRHREVPTPRGPEEPEGNAASLPPNGDVYHIGDAQTLSCIRASPDGKHQRWPG